MAYTKITSEDTSGKGVIGIPDTPALTTTAMQEKFDEIALDVLVPKHNALIEELESTESGKGADAIGFDTGTSGITAETAGAALRALKGELADKATTADVLTKDNAAEFTPTGQYNPATKKYVDDTVVAIGAGDMAKAVYDTDGDGVVDGAFGVYLHTKAGTVHALAGKGTSIKFNTTAAFNDGDTFTINGVAVEAQLINGDEIPGDFFAAGVVASCFLHDNKLTFGGGGAMGSWKFTAATSLPASVSKNTFVAIVTDIPATISTGENAPTAPSGGDVWFNMVDPSGGDVYSDGSVPFRCLGAYQYNAVSGEWVSINAYYSYLTEWKEVKGLPPAGGNLEDYTWDEINRIGELGRHEEYFSIGETKTVALTTGEVITLILVGFNSDALASDPTTYAPYSFHMQNCMNTRQQMELTNTNDNGWNGCRMRTTVLPEILLTLPAELQSVIKTVVKKSSAGNQSSNIVQTNDKLWLASEIEIFGTLTNSKSGEGSQYPYYATSGNRVKMVSNAAAPWWERSPHATNATHFCDVTASGTAFANAANTSHGVAFGLCV